MIDQNILPEKQILPDSNQIDSNKTDAETYVQGEEATNQEKQPSPANMVAGWGDPSEDDEYDPILSLLFHDGLDQPIEGLEAKITLPDGSSHESKTDELGAIHIPKPKDDKGEAKVSVMGLDGKEQTVCSFDLSRCDQAVRIRNPKVKKTVKAEPHHKHKPSTATRQAAKQTPPPKETPETKPRNQKETKQEVRPSNTAWYQLNQALNNAWHWLQDIVHPNHDEAPKAGNGKQPHDVMNAATKAGNPLSGVAGPEDGGAENLLLGVNNIYRPYIIAAGKRVGLIPQAIAALIDAEAAKKAVKTPIIGPDGKPVLYKKGKNKGQPVMRELPVKQWQADSKAATSSATGLTQFLNGTWLSMALTSGTHLCEQCQANQWVRNESDKRGKSHLKFVLANGISISTPWKKGHLGDANVKQCLDQRKNPEWAVMAAADYGKQNLQLLKTKGYKLLGLNDGEKAKLMYLMHHEGGLDGPLFIEFTLGNITPTEHDQKKYKTKLVQQIGSSKALINISKAQGNAVLAYRSWLSGYIDNVIDVSHFFAKGKGDYVRVFEMVVNAIGAKK